MTLVTPHPPRLEHINITVPDSEHTARLMVHLFGWQERWRGKAASGGHTVHVGAAEHYLALYSPPAGTPGLRRFKKGVPLNHIGIEVDDLIAAEARVRAAGLSPFGHDDYVPGRRFYFFDDSNIEFEIVSYAPVMDVEA